VRPELPLVEGSILARRICRSPSGSGVLPQSDRRRAALQSGSGKGGLGAVADRLLSAEGAEIVQIQGCQMAYFETKNPNLGKFWMVLKWKMLVYFIAIWFIIRPFGIFCGHLVYFMVIWYIFPVLVCCTKKKLATLVQKRIVDSMCFRSDVMNKSYKISLAMHEVQKRALPTLFKILISNHFCQLEIQF
jgi:hypothetical protein